MDGIILWLYILKSVDCRSRFATILIESVHAIATIALGKQQKKKKNILIIIVIIIVKKIKYKNNALKN